ncbi:hypothetical protein PRIPAC_71449 [Pristionchus pacificus]|uniref:Uncharacterized protein n=1 Tax=Pristionchus pacificus TaxID=54126 RepID=A0A2A6BRA1_PRIPA|nr:hypothetical protein PRIPAC_71449 [Pristionchus pacificus]|eukprot:PDM68454.1 hypothetical protein PRIPAC_43956 [Pristionchus pacificus]
MSIAIDIELEPALSLDRLHPDIIRRIIRADPDVATEMRLISRMWNSLAWDYLTKNPKLRSSLERVFFSRGIREDMYKGRKHRSRPSLHAGCLHMYTILPKRYSKRIGAGGWLKVHRNYNDDFVEVKKVPERILSADFSKWRNLYITVTIGLALELWGAIAIGAPTICSIIISIAICACIVMLVVMHNAPDQQTRRFSRLFCMFTHIETLVLDNFRISENCSKSRDAIGTVMKSLKGVRIDRLEIRENYMNPYLQNQIIKMCRNHNIFNVYITVQDADMSEFSKFVHALTANHVTLDVYERNGMDDRLYFDRSRQWWTSTANSIMRQQVSMKMTTIHDASFDKRTYRFGIKSHIRCEKIYGGCILPLKPIPIRRGFNHRWN